MKNRDYTLIVRDVEPKDQSRMSWLFQALGEMFNTLGLGTVTDSKYSPEPEQWIVEFQLAGRCWVSSVNRLTNGVFSTQKKAEEAIQENWKTGRASSSDYRAVRVSPTRFEAHPLSRAVSVPESAEEWTVEISYFPPYDVWSRSSNDATHGYFKTQAEAQAALQANWDMGKGDGLVYRVTRLKPTRYEGPAQSNQEWIVEFDTNHAIPKRKQPEENWMQSGDPETRGPFLCRDAAEYAIKQHRPTSVVYRAKRIK